MSVKVSLLEQEDEYLGRNVELNVNNKAIEGFQIARRSNRTKYENVIFNKSDGMAISEYSINIDHDKLDSLASDNEAYRIFVQQKLPRIKSTGEINVIIFRVDETKGHLTNTDIETLADLLMTRGNDIIVPPFVKTYNGEFNVDRYVYMIEALHDSIGFESNIACSIPEQASKKDISRIMDAMDTSSQVYFKDFYGKKVIDPVSEMQIRTVLRKVRDIETEYSEGSFIYAYDSRLSPKNGNNKDFAEGQIVSAIGLNAVGPKRKREILPPSVIAKIKDSNPLVSQRLFNVDDYRLYSIASEHITDRFSDFIWHNYSCDYHDFGVDELRNSVFAFNFSERTHDVNNIDRAVAENEMKQYLISKDVPKNLVKCLETVTKKVNSHR